jgi:preprotein translocase subunit YajC
MPTPLLSVIAAVSTKAATTTKSSSSSSGLFLILLIAFAALYFLVLRPRSRKMRTQGANKADLAVGDEVISAGGILGTVTAVAGDEIVVEVAPGTSLTFWRRAINLRTAVAGAPQSGAVADEVPPGEHYGIDDRYDDESTEAEYVEAGDEGETYDDASYDDATYGEDEAAVADDGAAPDGAEGHDETDHRDVTGGPGEDR